MHFVFHKNMFCVRNPTVSLWFAEYYDIAHTADQKAVERGWIKEKEGI
jgi:hypothetical protein